MKKILIFDLDGTLVDTVEDIAGAVNATLIHYNLSVRTVDEIRGMVGNGAKDLITKALPENMRTSIFVNEALSYYRKYYDEHLLVKTKVYDGLKDTLLSLKRNGAKLCVLSNKDDNHVKTIVNELLPNLFTKVSGYSPDFPRKPNPESLNALLKEFGVSGDDVAYIGDLRVDVETARNAGIFSVGVLWGFGGKDAFEDCLPNVVIKEPAELLKI